MVSAKLLTTAVLAGTVAADVCFPIDVGQIVFGLAELATDLLYAYYDGFYVRWTAHGINILDLALQVIYAPDYACILAFALDLPIEVIHGVYEIVTLGGLLGGGDPAEALGKLLGGSNPFSSLTNIPGLSS